MIPLKKCAIVEQYDRERMKKQMKKISKGLFLSIAIAIIATLLGNFFPIIGSAVFAIILGLLLNNTLTIPADFQPGIKL